MLYWFILTGFQFSTTNMPGNFNFTQSSNAFQSLPAVSAAGMQGIQPQVQVQQNPISKYNNELHSHPGIFLIFCYWVQTFLIWFALISWWSCTGPVISLADIIIQNLKRGHVCSYANKKATYVTSFLVSIDDVRDINSPLQPSSANYCHSGEKATCHTRVNLC